MPEVLEIQIQDKTPNGAGGPPRAPQLPAGGSQLGAGTASRQSPHLTPLRQSSESRGGRGGVANWPLQEFSETIKKAHEGFDKVKDKFTEALRTVKEHWSKTPAAKAPAAPTAVAKAPAAPAAPQVAARVNGTAMAGMEEGGAAVAEAGGLMAGLGALEVATAGVATAFVAVAAVVGVAAVAAIEAFKIGMHVATDEVRLFGLKLSSAAVDLQAFSPDLMSANIRADMRSLFDDIKEAQTIGPDLARLAEAQSEAQHQLREIWLPIKKVIVEYMADFLEKIVDWLKDARVLLSKEFWQELAEDLAAAITPNVAGGMSIADATAKLGKKFDEIKEKLDEENQPLDVEMFLRSLYDAKAFDDNFPRDFENDPRPNIPLVQPFAGM